MAQALWFRPGLEASFLAVLTALSGAWNSEADTDKSGSALSIFQRSPHLETRLPASLKLPETRWAGKDSLS